MRSVRRSGRPSRSRSSSSPLEALADDEHAIVDCLTIWVANLLERGHSEDEILAEAERIAELAASRQAPVTVANEVGLGVVPATPLGRAYRDLLGGVNRAFADARRTRTSSWRAGH